MMAIRGRLLLVSFLILFSTFVAPRYLSAETSKSLTLGSVLFPPHSTADLTGFEDLVTKEMFRRIGVHLNIVQTPAERALVNANEGVEDGTLPRVGGMNKKYSNLVQLDEPTLRRDYVAFTRNSDIEISDWEGLKPYDVGIITGWKILEWNIKGTRSLTMVGNAEQLFRLLESGRVDVVVYARWGGMHMIKERGIENVRVLEPPLVSRDVFVYLHNKHRHIAPRLSAALRKMKQDGTYQKIQEETLGILKLN